MKAKSFEELKVWQDSRELVKSIYELTSAAKFQKDYGLRDQIQRASVSIMKNIVEGLKEIIIKNLLNFSDIQRVLLEK